MVGEGSKADFDCSHSKHGKARQLVLVVQRLDSAIHRRYS